MCYLHSCRGAIAQSVEPPSKVPIWCNSTDVGSNTGATVKKKFLATPSGERRDKCEEWEKKCYLNPFTELKFH